MAKLNEELQGEEGHEERHGAHRHPGRQQRLVHDPADPIASVGVHNQDVAALSTYVAPRVPQPRWNSTAAPLPPSSLSPPLPKSSPSSKAPLLADGASSNGKVASWTNSSAG